MLVDPQVPISDYIDGGNRCGRLTSPSGRIRLWNDAVVGDTWYTMDARHNLPRVGRILMARGRDAADVALLTSFGASRLERFNVWCDEVGPEALAA